jgi:hypothetical protein
MTLRGKLRGKNLNGLLCIPAILGLVVVGRPALAEDSTYLYAVQISATIQVSPPQITLNWYPDAYGVNNFVIYRKAKTDDFWGTGTVLSGTTTSFADNNVAAGSAYEYQIVKNATRGYTGYGYIYAGINAPLTDDRGKVVLVVATNATSSLGSELARLQSDLVGDGWRVIRHDVSSNDTPSAVKNLIVADYQADPANVQAAFLFGHVPILQSTNLNYDGHLARPMPADAFYADMDGYWPTDAAHSPGFLPSDVELMVGRVDLFNMPGNGAAVPWPNETELLRNYLNKDHNWRHKLIQVNRRALMGNLRGDEQGQATAASGYRNFEPLVGPGNTIEANVESDALPEQRWSSMLAAGNYLWAYGCGAGQPTAVSGLGTHDGTFYDAWSTDIVGQNAQAVFVMLFGSWFGQWDVTDDLMRSFLATPTMGLTCCLAGRPHWFVHHMGLGETIGYGTRLTMNNSTLYQNQSNDFTRAVYIALMGDPTLRMDQVAPPGSLVAPSGTNAANLTWSGSSDPVVGYHVYRSASAAGPFARLTSSPIAATTYSDTGASAGTYTYMVRAVKLENTPSGSYYNASQGVFATISISPPPIVLAATRGEAGISLAWNSAVGVTYRVQARAGLNSGSWTDLSGTIAASGTSTTWVDTTFATQAQRFYRISSP